MNKNPNYKSKCCGEEVIISSGIPDFESKNEIVGQTFHFECSKCKKPCDVLDKGNKVNA